MPPAPPARAGARVLAIDDHPVFRAGLVAALRGVSRVAGVLEAASAAEGLRHWREGAVDLVTLDLSLPDQQGFSLLEEARGAGLPGAVVVLSAHDDKGYRLRAQALGAVAFVCKSVSVTELCRVVDAALAGATAFTALPGSPAPGAGSPPAAPLAAQLATLTQAEQRVLALLGRNLTSREIARALDVSHRTVENHRANICRKLELRGPHRLLEVALSLSTSGGGAA